MPIKRRIPKLSRMDLTAVQVAGLLDGFVEGSWDSYFWRYAPPRLYAQRREAWERHGEALLAYWVFGTIPHGWDAELARNVAAIARVGGPGTRPSIWWELEAPAPRAHHETEIAYLERHGLLLPGERARYDAAPPRPRDPDESQPDEWEPDDAGYGPPIARGGR